MAPKIGYVLPTREFIMNGIPEAVPLLDLAAQAEALGFDSVWVGDSIVARPRHEALTLLAAIAVRALKVTLGDAAVLVTDSHRTDPVVARGRGYGWEYGDIDASLGARIP